MLAGEVMDVLDANIINVAGPALGRELGASPAQLQWAIGGYALAMGASLIIAGRLGDIFGRRRMFLTAMTAFAFTSLLCAAAPTIGVLIAGSFLQGAAGDLLRSAEGRVGERCASSGRSRCGQCIKKKKTNN